MREPHADHSMDHNDTRRPQIGTVAHVVQGGLYMVQSIGGCPNAQKYIRKWHGTRHEWGREVHAPFPLSIDRT